MYDFILLKCNLIFCAWILSSVNGSKRMLLIQIHNLWKTLPVVILFYYLIRCGRDLIEPLRKLYCPPPPQKEENHWKV